MRILIFLALVAMAPCSQVALAQTNALAWQRYRESNANVELRYPADVFRPDPSKTSPAGRVFVTDDGSARLLIGSLENVDRHTPASYQRFIAEESYKGSAFDYRPVGGNWTVLSGTLAATMFYQKVIFSCGARIINTFALTYPIARRSFFDPIVEEIEDSFRPGEQCDNFASIPRE